MGWGVTVATVQNTPTILAHLFMCWWIAVAQRVKDSTLVQLLLGAMFVVYCTQNAVLA